jgi:hypothetical protein
VCLQVAVQHVRIAVFSAGQGDACVSRRFYIINLDNAVPARLFTRGTSGLLLFEVYLQALPFEEPSQALNVDIKQDNIGNNVRTTHERE